MIVRYQLMSKKILIIPTYNERYNVPILYKKIRKYNKNLEILFVEDSSPDRTIDVIRTIQKKDNKVKVLLRQKKRGIGSAHKTAISWAVKRKYNLCITMDADLTHDPKYIPKMIRFSPKYHLVQTNRFLDKKSIDTWPIYRRLLTRSRFLLLKLLLNINYDSSGAFRCYNFKKLDYRLLLFAKNDSYSFFWESIYILVKERSTIKEIKMVQKYRSIGTSKMEIKHWFHGLYYLFEVYLKDLFNISYK